ncbi:MAG: hypothetical protein WCX61_00545 [Candidatus Peribacteraceae bacterium]|jgi:hypothetical protein
MRHIYRIIGLLLVLIIMVAPIAGADENDSPLAPDRSADLCRAKVDELLAKEHRTYRTVLFGREKAEDSPMNATRYDVLGRVWYKVAKNTWRRIGDNQTETEETDDEDMDASAEMDSIPVEDGGVDLSPSALPRRGLFDVKRVLTSDLIPYLTQGMRALGCRTDMVCYLVEKSTEKKWEEIESFSIPIQVSGCLPTKWDIITECTFAESEGAQDKADVIQYCERVSGALIERENEVLKMLVEYDAAYRSLLQFAGSFDEFLSEFRWTLTGNLREAASVIGWLNRIPCFIASCDEWPPALDPHKTSGGSNSSSSSDSSEPSPGDSES